MNKTMAIYFDNMHYTRVHLLFIFLFYNEKMLKEFEWSGKAMGTDYSIAIVCISRDLALETYEKAKNEIKEYEERFSRFLSTSELSILNEKKDMVVSQTFLDVTKKAYQLFMETGGIFNPLVQIVRFGYDKNFINLENNKHTKDDSLYNIDFHSTIIDEKTSSIHLKEGQKLDYGGFLKGYLAEIIAKKIKSHSENITGVIVNIGGDIHTQGLDENGNKFVFNIYNPILKNEDIKITLYNQSLATSGTYKRSWFISGKKMHHILDSSGSQNPENDIVSASVIHENGANAEAYTKVFLSLGHERALKLLKNKNVSFIIIKNDGQVNTNTQ